MCWWAIIYLKIYNSSYRLLPKYTHIEREVWIDILKNGTLIKELWQSQQKLGENGIFGGGKISYYSDAYKFW